MDQSLLNIETYSQQRNAVLAKYLAQLISSIDAQTVAITAASHIITGSFTLGAAATTVVAQTSVTASSIIIPFATNAAAGTLMGSTKSLYISAKSAGVSFTVATASAVAAAGTEQFSYLLVNPS